MGAVILLAFRLSTYEMNVAPRQAFLSSAVLPEERTAVLGLFNIIATLAQGFGPMLAGYLAGIGKFWIAFVLCGALKCSYDVLLGVSFWTWRSREEEMVKADEDDES